MKMYEDDALAITDINTAFKQTSDIVPAVAPFNAKVKKGKAILVTGREGP
jgi:hypothetical protein